MQYEVDYIPVGEGEKSGDAICIRYGNLQGPRSEQVVMVIDGGDKKSGAKIVEHIRTVYNTETVDHVVLTHPDSDHASGLCTVLEELEVVNLLMHLPWEHAAYIKEAFKDTRWTDHGISKKVEKALKHASELHNIAIQKGVKIVEPFEGVHTPDGVFKVLGPSEEFYQEMLLNFRSTPQPKIANLIEKALSKAKEVLEKIEDSFHIDLLNDDNDTTSPENNSSTVCFFNINGRKLLFTGDVGKTGLTNALDYLEGQDENLVGLSLFDVPHHGSKRNLSSTLLKRLPKGGIACVSATGVGVKHPSRRVTNALLKHGYIVNVTRQSQILYHYQGNMRGWNGIVTQEQFHEHFEE